MHSKKNIRIRVAGIMLQDDKLLFIMHKKNGKIYSLLPGGGVDYGESLTESLVREFKEELNIDVEVGEVMLIADSISPEGERHILNVCFQCSYKSGDFKIGDDKRLHDYDFIPVNEINNIEMYPPFNEALINCLEKKNNNIYIGSLWK